MNEEKKNNRLLKPFLIVIAVLIALILLTSVLGGFGIGEALHSMLPAGWFGSENADTEVGYNGAKVTYRNMDEDRIYEEVIFIPNGDDTYIYCEAVFPEAAWEEDVPLVVMGHGFTGTLNSGGAKSLAHMLAKEGIATIRTDFDPRTAASVKAGKTGSYDLISMQDDMSKAIDYMCGTYHIDEYRIGIYARSMGGRAAMMMANESYGGTDFAAMALVAPAGNENAMIYYMGGRDKWEAMKSEAKENGFVDKQGLKLSYEWFTEFEDYNPCSFGDKFGNNPVLVIYNTLDNVVLPETSLECAAAYQNSAEIEVTSEDGHGYEMAYEDSELRTYLMGEICDFFAKNL